MATLQASTITGNQVLTQSNYPQTLATYTFSGNFTANTWYTLFRLDTIGHNGIMGVVGFADTWNMGGTHWSSLITSPGVYPITPFNSNASQSFQLKNSVDSGHAPNGEVWQFRIVHNFNVSGRGQEFQWLSSNSYSNANNTSGRTAQVKLIRIV